MLITQQAGFSLTGLGYVEGCRIEKQNGFVRIRMPLSVTQVRQTEDICLDCAVDDSLLGQLEPIYDAWKNDHTVKLRFEARYAGFNCCHVGREVDDPDFMLMFLARLQSVEKWYCDGKLVKPQAITKTIDSQAAA